MVINAPASPAHGQLGLEKKECERHYKCKGNCIIIQTRKERTAGSRLQEFGAGLG